MSEKVSGAVSTGVGSATSPNPVPLGASGGKVGPDAGKMSPAQKASIRAQNLDEVVERLNSQSRRVGTALRFRVDSMQGTSVIQVLDRDTGELIRQIPPTEGKALASIGRGADLKLLDDLI